MIWKYLWLCKCIILVLFLRGLRKWLWLRLKVDFFWVKMECMCLIKILFLEILIGSLGVWFLRFIIFFWEVLFGRFMRGSLNLSLKWMWGIMDCLLWCIFWCCCLRSGWLIYGSCCLGSNCYLLRVVCLIGWSGCRSVWGWWIWRIGFRSGEIDVLIRVGVIMGIIIIMCCSSGWKLVLGVLFWCCCIRRWWWRN